jgi:hypothetical protein
MKFTLLEMVQEILSSMDSDEVNSISDTPEAMQVALVIRRAYLDLASRLNLSEHFDFFQLTASGDNTLPIVMYRPADVDQLVWLKYDKRLAGSDPVSFKDVRYQAPATFFDRMFMMNTNDSNVSSTDFTIDGDDFKLLYQTDRHPNYWTSIDDYTLIFDAHKSSLDTTLQKSKTHCYGLKNTSFTLSDAFTPSLDSQQFSLLVNEAKALAWAELKQATHARAERQSRTQLIRTQRNKRALPSGHVLPDYENVVGYGRK